MLTQQPLRELFVTDEPRRTRDGLPPIPALLLTEPGATLEGNMRGVESVAGVLLILIDGCTNFTDSDWELVERLRARQFED